jgi:hypothetical protein
VTQVELETPEVFEPNAFYERLLEMRATNRKAFDGLSPVSKLALLTYEQHKRQHEQKEEP